MNRRNFTSFAAAAATNAILVCILLPLLSATSARAQTDAAATQTVRIQFQGRLGGQIFACGSQYEGVGSKATTVTPVDLRFFVSEIELLRPDSSATPVTLDQDGVWQYKSLALIDLEDATGGCRNGNSAMHREVTGTVATGTYVGLRFTLGVPFDLDHIDSSDAPSPLNMTAMQWSWQNGYKFLRAEVSPLTPRPATIAKTDGPSGAHALSRMRTGASGFPVHLGSTGCASASPDASPGEECKNPNRSVISLTEFDAAKDIVVFDLSKLLAHSDLSANSADTAPGCMSFEGDPDCIPIMEALGIAYGGSPAKPQVVFYRGTNE